jgi:glycyl-tRNA synthetase beta chain
MLQQRDAPYDIVNAVMAVGFNKPLEVYQRAMAVHKIRFEPDFEALAIAFKRVKNILGSSSRTIFSSVTVELLVEEAEKQLFCNLQRVIPQADQHLASGRYYEALKVSASLRPAVDLLFDKVLVMSPDVALRNNRLALLQALAGLFLKVADISEIVAGNAA